MILNGHDYVACQARRAAIRFQKEDDLSFASVPEIGARARFDEEVWDARQCQKNRIANRGVAPVTPLLA